MIKEILNAAGIPSWQGRSPNPPAKTYAIYFDDVAADGPDGYNLIFNHDVMVELYEPKADPDAEAALEAQLMAHGVHWTKEDRYWLQNAQRYQVIYEFSYNEKRRA